MRRVSIVPVEHLEPVTYDLLVCAIGYEKRSRHAASRLHRQARTKVAVGFKDRQVLSYARTWRWFQRAGFEVSESTDEEFRVHFREVFRRLRPGKAHVAIDVSSMSRLRIALALEELYFGDRPVTVDFLYSPARFSAPEKQISQIVRAAPVTSFFAGWSDPTEPNVAIVGLGYERDKAMGVLEYLEAREVWLYQPTGTDKRYEQNVTIANKAVLDAVSRDHVISYNVLDPFNTFLDIRNLVDGTLGVGRPIIVPFGPKIFMVAAALVALAHRPKVSLWRVSSGPFEKPVERIATGKLVSLRMVV